MPKLPWKPWHEVVKLRKELETGELSLQERIAAMLDFPPTDAHKDT
jgi:hypothetical protein